MMKSFPSFFPYLNPLRRAGRFAHGVGEVLKKARIGSYIGQQDYAYDLVVVIG